MFFFKQKTAYEMRMSDWSSDVCSSDLQLGMAHAEARRQRDALAVVLVADALVHELVGDAGGQLVAVLAGDDVQHHVDGGGAAGAGEAVAVDLEELAGPLDVREILAEAEIGRASGRERVGQ